MLEKMKNKLPGEKKAEKSEKPMPGVEIEIGEPEDEGEEASAGPSESPDEEVAVGELAQFSDDELKAELEKRGMQVTSGGASVTPLPEAPSEESTPAEPGKKEPAPQMPPRKKSPIVAG